MKFKKARRVIREAFKKDPDFKRTYVDNVATRLLDAYVDPDAISGLRTFDLRDKTTRDKLATEIIDLIFGK
ncbi:hypothetical protein LCGC14_1038800 [marine sediment metagenome]|uniref:Uncharacterized protein n=1 Tax=marine sediment metagenome TaxID=412755 RepID=A0A0F9MWY3_9ZZZZ